MKVRILKTFVKDHRRYDVAWKHRFNSREDAAEVQRKYYEGADTAIHYDKLSGKWLLGTRFPLGWGVKGR